MTRPKRPTVLPLEELVHQAILATREGRPFPDIAALVCEHLISLHPFTAVRVGQINPRLGQLDKIAQAGAPGDLESPQKLFSNLKDLIAQTVVAKNNLDPASLLPPLRIDPLHTSTLMAFPLFSREGLEGVLEISGEFQSQGTDPVSQSLPLFIASLTLHLQQMNDMHKLRLQQNVIQSLNRALYVTDASGHILWANGYVTSMTGFKLSDIQGKLFLDLLPQHYVSVRLDKVQEALQRGEHWSGELVMAHRNGAEINVFHVMTPLHHPEHKDQVLQYVIVQNDLSAKKSAETRINYLTHYDLMTGTPNRARFKDHLAHAISTAQSHGQESLTLFFIDLFDFERINDTAGQQVGDQFLRIVADRLRTVAQDQGILARVGGDEFAILYPGLHNKEAITSMAQEILNSLTQPEHVDGIDLTIKGHIGISRFPEDAKTGEELLNYAELAVRKIQTDTPNSFGFFEPSMNVEVINNLEIERGLRRALENNEFQLYFQPQLHLKTGQIVGAETLIRWQNPERGFMSPDQFISIAEASGLIIPIGEWVIKNAFEYAKHLEKFGLQPFGISINLSALQFNQPELVNQIKHYMDQSGVDPRRIEFELTETVLMRNVTQTYDFLNKLTQLGVKIAIDDFGMGYSSLNYLKRFPVNRIKIDKSFIHDMTFDYDDAEIIRVIISLGHTLGLEVVAEGVINETQVNLLIEQECDVVQGYFVSEPLSVPDFEKFLSQYY